VSGENERLAPPPEPLVGLSMVVTRAETQGMELAAPLLTLGAQVVLLPMISIAAPVDGGPLNRAIDSIAQYDWIFFTSTNAVQGVVPHVKARPRGRVGVVGRSTRICAEGLGWTVDVVPGEFTAEGLLTSLESFDLRGQRVLIPSGDLARDVLPAVLRERGALVDVVEAYSNRIPPDAELRAKRLFSAPTPPDWVIFASPSAVDNLLSLVGAAALGSVKIASIGPTTSAAVRRHGLTVTAEPEEHTNAGLVLAIVRAVVS
jgi:uroporphyrinogen-III synthase